MRKSTFQAKGQEVEPGAPKAPRGEASADASTDAGKGDGVFKALADEQRRRILQLLRSGEQPAGALAGSLGVKPATVSHHLAQLKAAGLVRVRRDGQQRIYTLNTSMVEEVLLLISNLFHAERKEES